jgi:hypothetical protein
MLGAASLLSGQAQAATIEFSGIGSLSGDSSSLSGSFTSSDLVGCESSGCSVDLALTIDGGGDLAGGTLVATNLDTTDGVLSLMLGDSIFSSVGFLYVIASTVLDGTSSIPLNGTIISGVLATFGLSFADISIGDDFGPISAKFESTLTAVPLPPAAILFGSAMGLVGVIGAARRRFTSPAGV